MARRTPSNKQVKKVKDSIHVLSLASYSSPQVIEDSRNEWIAYGDDNDYFQYLIDRYNGSPTNK